GYFQGDPPVIFGGGVGEVFAAGGGDDLLESILHVFRLQDFVVAPFEVETQHGDSPLVHRVRIEIAIAVGIWDHFAASGEADLRAVHLAQVALQLDAITAAQDALGTIEVIAPRQAAPAAKLDVISAREGHLDGLLVLVVPPRHVHVHAADAVFIARGQIFQNREIAVYVR